MFRYGCHIFHTKHNRVKEYVQQYSNWVPYEHRVIAKAKDVEGKVKFVPMPPNQVIFWWNKMGGLLNILKVTVNMLFHENITSKEEMVSWLDKRRPSSASEFWLKFNT